MASKSQPIRKYKDLSKSEIIARSPLDVNVLLSANQERAHSELNNRRVIRARKAKKPNVSNII